jgi:AraC-like DNA-binding protein
MRLAANEAWARAGVIPLMPRDPGSVSPWSVDRDAHGRIEVCDIGGVRLAKIRSNPICIEQKHAPATENTSASYKLLLQVSGRSLIQQDGREVMLSSGDWTLYGGHRPFAVANLERSEQRMVILPRNELWGGMLDLDALTVRPFGAKDRSSKQLITFLDSALDTVSLLGAQAGPDLAAVAIHLSRLALIENAGAYLDRTHSEVVRDRMRNYIACHLRDPNLSVSTIAAALNCSTRYVYKVFADGNETVAQHILNRRLEKCLAELKGGPSRNASIAVLAHGWGFRSLSHFSTAFRKRYGVTPGQQRTNFESS